jgi:hypothetical protein
MAARQWQRGNGSAAMAARQWQRGSGSVPMTKLPQKERSPLRDRRTHCTSSRAIAPHPHHRSRVMVPLLTPQNVSSDANFLRHFLHIGRKHVDHCDQNCE